MSASSEISASEPAQEEQAHSDEVLALVADLTVWNRMPYLSARRLIELNCKRWPVWRPWYIKRIAQARREDDTTDWYFPLYFQRTFGKNCRDMFPSFFWTWKGIHLSSGHILGGQPRALPSLAHLPPQWTSDESHPCFDIVVGSGGLILIKLRTELVPEPQLWESLMVSNPLRKEWRVLPAADCRDVGLSSWNYRGVTAHMVVDDEANSYKVILISRDFVCVYKSACNSWTCKAFPQPGLWGYHGGVEWGYAGASACVGGRLYFADLEVGGYRSPVYDDNSVILGHGNVRTFEIDEEAGRWKPPTLYPLRNFFLQNSPSNHGFQLGSYALEIVECMGGIYAVIPANFVVSMLTSDHDIASRNDFVFMPLQFHILQLRGAGSAAQHGILRIQIPLTEVDNMNPRSESNLLTNSKRTFYRLKRNWWRCTARGSVIWLTCEDYLLQYDVLSGQSQTHIIQNWSANAATMTYYRPSFHMKP